MGLKKAKNEYAYDYLTIPPVSGPVANPCPESWVDGRTTIQGRGSCELGDYHPSCYRTWSAYKSGTCHMGRPVEELKPPVKEVEATLERS